MSEFDWIARYFAPLAKRRGAAGLRDDVAVLSGQGAIVTVDAILEDVHFLPTDPIETIARKLVRVNVSDMIAKGAHPSEALLTLGWPQKRSENELARFAKAFGEELAAWGAHLIGGDTVTSPNGLFLSLTLTGVPAGPLAPIKRSGAQVGDLIWVTGEIGAGYKGLCDALSGTASQAVEMYRVPDVPPLQVANLIAHHATASMDVSDGLIGDLQKLITASGCGGHLELDRVQIHRGDEAPESDEEHLADVLACCTGGDDYQCLFTVPERLSEAIITAPEKISNIGRISSSSELTLSWQGKSVPLPKRSGFTH